MPGCVLICAVAPVASIEIMRRRRRGQPAAQLTNGPAKLCQAMAIDRGRYGVDLGAGGPLRVVIAGRCRGAVATSARVGISQARDWPLRHMLVGEPNARR